MTSDLVPHEWDRYGKPTPRDVDAPPLTEFECDHAPKHRDIGEHLTTLREELSGYESDRDRAQEDLDEAEGAIEETRQLILDAEIALRGTK